MRRIPLKIIALATAAVCGIAACANIFGITGGVLEDGSVPFDGASSEGAADAGPDAPFDGGYIPPDANYADCGSGARSVSADAGWFVKAGAPHPPSADCSINNPCGALQDAIGVASPAGGGTIFIASGVYNEALLFDNNTAPLSFQGGWDVDGSAWTPQCTSNLAIIAGDPSHNATVELDQTPNTISFSLLEISNQPASVQPGTNLYGILALSPASLVLDNVNIFVGDAGAGSNGSGTVPIFSDASPTDCNVPGNGANGSGGANGSPAAIAPTTTGFVEQPSATPGFPGYWGQTGTGGTDGSCANCVDQCNILNVGDCDAAVLPTCAAQTDLVCGSPGMAGCGGQGGYGGIGGTSGGSSIGIFLYQGNLVVTNGAISAGAGGVGGAGYPGDFGYTGGTGTMGNPGYCTDYSGCGSMCFPFGPPSCMPEGGSTSLLPGGNPGGDGGNGGAGGQGGGGAGGNSYGVYVYGVASVSLSGIHYASQSAAPGGAVGGPSGGSGNTNGDY